MGLSGFTFHLKYLSGLASIKKAGVWYVDIPGTSSSSIRTELAAHFGKVYGKSDLVDPELNVNLQLIPSHLTSREMCLRLGKKSWNRLFTFSMIRNPWDRMLSLFRYRKSAGELAGSTSFEQYLEMFFQRPTSPESPYHYHGYYYQSLDYITDERGRIMVDFVGRYEQRQTDLNIVGNKVKCPHLGAVHTGGTYKNGYRGYYNKQAREMVSVLCKRDIQAFDYRF